MEYAGGAQRGFGQLVFITAGNDSSRRSSALLYSPGSKPEKSSIFRAKLKQQSVCESADGDEVFLRSCFDFSPHYFSRLSDMEEANKLVGAGKKHLVMGKIPEAVSVLQEACGMLAKKYGDTADECGEAFFWCGKALLDLARMENSVLGNALEGVPEEEEEDAEEKPKDSNIESTENIDEKTRDELREQVYDAMAEKKNEDAKKAEENQNGNLEKIGDAEKAAEEQNTAKEEEDKEKNSNMDGSKSSESEEKTENGEKADAEDSGKELADKEEEEPADKPEEAEAGDEEEGGDEAEMEGDEEEEGDTEVEKDSDSEEVGNLQLAWEMLELAKVIYKRKETKDDQLMAAQAHLKLGEVSAESGNYTQALEDFLECLKLQLKHLDSDSRLLAETRYQLGLTYSLTCQYGQAVEELNSSISVIKSRLDKLQEAIDEAEGLDALPDERKEMEELKALLPEIQEKVEDATEGLKTANADAEAMKKILDGSTSSLSSAVQNGDTASSSVTKDSLTNGSSSASGHASKAPVSDISHLVRKKRKPEESPVKEGVSKKVKQEDAHTNGVQEPHSNGVQSANGDATGHNTNMELESQ
ncbi:hypothetical protein LDENG_00276630 [Lucifuga dentata]|nr:hypothetical protein LDENG_00276630 [Lucifuga dentata]